MYAHTHTHTHAHLAADDLAAHRAARAEGCQGKGEARRCARVCMDVSTRNDVRERLSSVCVCVCVCARTAHGAYKHAPFMYARPPLASCSALMSAASSSEPGRGTRPCVSVCVRACVCVCV